MAVAETCAVKYIFLDIVGYTKNRSVEAQTDIIDVINNIVKVTISALKIDGENVIYLPTGDGICISILKVNSPFDIHVIVALEILEKLGLHNVATEDTMRKFAVRIGINENKDNIVTDINGQKNVAGTGINMAQRIMNVANGNQIIVGRSVYDVLQHREKYLDSFRPLHTFIKHGEQITVYQYIKKDAKGLNIEIPAKFKKIKKEDKKLSPLIAYYFAHSIKNEKSIINCIRTTGNEYTVIIVLYFMAIDSLEYKKSTDINPYSPKINYDRYSNFEEIVSYYWSHDFWVRCQFSGFIGSNELMDYADFFEMPPGLICVNDIGIEKLRKECPNIWEEFELDNYV